MYIDPDSLTGSFVLGQAFGRLERLTLDFDFERERRAANFVDLQPKELAAIIDDLLSVRELLPGGNVAVLVKLKAILEGTIAAIFEQGQLAAQEYWAQASPDERAHLATLMPEVVIAKAWEHVSENTDTNQANWFIEGFCRQWWLVEYLNYVYNTPSQTE
jgi:hypothetical protein